MSAANLTRDEALARARLIADPVYEVSLDLAGSEETFGVDARIRFRCSEPGASSFVEFVAPAIHAATLNGERLDVGKVFDGKRIRLPRLEETNELYVVADAAFERNGIGLH